MQEHEYFQRESTKTLLLEILKAYLRIPKVSPKVVTTVPELQRDDFMHDG